MSKIDIQNMLNVYQSLLFSFHEDPDTAENPDPRFVEVWEHFLGVSGWQEEEFWNTYDEMSCGDCDNSSCEDCDGCCCSSEPEELN